MKTTKQLAQIVTALIASQDGFTITADGKPLERGFVVGGLLRAPNSDSLAKLKQPKSAADYEELTKETQKLLTRYKYLLEQGVSVGGWRQGEEISLDLVTTYTDRAEAIEAAKHRHQIALGRIESYRYAEEVTF